MDIKFYEMFLGDGYSIAIKGVRQPSVAEAQEFYDRTSKRVGADHSDEAHTVVKIEEITEYEVQNFFDTSHIDEWEVFGA